MSLEKLIFGFVVLCCAYTTVVAQDNCTVPKEPKFRGFIRGQLKKYPREEAEKALSQYPEIAEALNVFATETEDDPRMGNDIDDLVWMIPCPMKAKNLQYYGIKDKKKVCWVLQPLWIRECAKKTCDYTFQNKLYYQCRPFYYPVQFWAYCPSHDDGPFKLFLRYVPRYCDCRRYFCGVEASPLPVSVDKVFL